MRDLHRECSPWKILVVLVLLFGMVGNFWGLENCQKTQPDTEVKSPEEAMFSALYSQKKADVNFVGETARGGGGNCPDQPPPGVHTAAICCVVKQEDAYIDDWVAYHHALGFSDIYIYDNTDDFEMKQWATQKKGACHVTVKHFPGVGPQCPAYLDCARSFGVQRNHTWIAYIDPDEYLVLMQPKKHKSVNEFLEEYLERGALAVHWKIMGSAGQDTYQPLPMTLRFRYGDPGIHDHVKSIVRLEHMDLNQEPHPHFPYLLPNYERKNTQGTRVDNHASWESQPGDVALLYHYGYRSKGEYLQKRLKGRSTGKWTDFDNELVQGARAGNFPKGEVFDDTAWQAVKRVLPEYRAYEDILKLWSKE